MNTQTIKKTDLKKIWEIACESWKKVLLDYTLRNPWGDDVELTQAEIKAMFAAADDKQIKVLDKYLTRTKEITDIIKSVNDIVKHLGEEDEEVVEYHKLVAAKVKKHTLNSQIIVMLAKALNEGWIADTTNSKYYPYFRLENFSYDDYYYWASCSAASARLCFKNAKLAQYAGTQFLDIYKDYILY